MGDMADDYSPGGMHAPEYENDEELEEIAKEQIIMASEPHIMRGVKCNLCNGDGYTAEHNPNDPHKDGCCSGSCPIQVECEKCQGTGYIK
jgi:hypothetical protein